MHFLPAANQRTDSDESFLLVDAKKTPHKWRFKALKLFLKVILLAYIQTRTNAYFA